MNLRADSVSRSSSPFHLKLIRFDEVAFAIQVGSASSKMTSLHDYSD